ncbi:hypothetical protein [Spongiibacter marinus]|uniref:hypothetical protein n=1 Tax=Spongiibacter marinus TaxID=354246 RepID=UPI003C4DDBC1
MKLQQRTLAAAILLSSTAVFAATPNVFTGETSAPITISGTISEVVACSFGGTSQDESTPGTADGLSFAFGSEGAQYEATASETLTISCSDTASGNNYQVAMTVAGATADFSNRSADIAVTIGADSKTATLEASEDGGATFTAVDQIATSLTGTDGSVSYTFKATISDTGTSFGDVAAESAQSLYVKFDAETPEEEDDFGFPEFPPAS